MSLAFKGPVDPGPINMTRSTTSCGPMTPIVKSPVRCALTSGCSPLPSHALYFVRPPVPTHVLSIAALPRSYPLLKASEDRFLQNVKIRGREDVLPARSESDFSD